jgi:type VI secretion system (T6SS) phospholipase Tle1-like effector
VRCVSHVLEACGIPTEQPGQASLNLDPKSVRKIAGEAVRTLYTLGMPIRNEAQAQEKANAFRKKYSSKVGADVGASAFLVGIWDAVAAIGWQRIFPDWAYDRHFAKDVRYARHLQSIDEGRSDFKRVAWGGSGTVLDPPREDEPEQFAQIWFAGNHADIGGSYPENESRLSDITLSWMVDFITNKISETHKVLVDPGHLRLYPSSDGMMHDECMVGMGGTDLKWKRTVREVPHDAVLHATVYERLALPEARNFTSYGPYRPAALRNHDKAKAYYSVT